ncbi:MAG: HlyD family type I secretion periplasmic adaptor subunit [Aquidulcibacter sp.]
MSNGTLAPRPASGEPVPTDQNPVVTLQGVEFQRVQDSGASINYRGPMRLGLVVITLCIVVFGTWSALAPLDSAVVAHGTLVVESKRKAVQHLEGGIVKELLVKDGQAVQEGQPLIRLDATRAQAGLSVVQGQLDAAMALDTRLAAERDKLKEVVFPPELTSRANDPQVKQLMEAQRRQFLERRLSLENQIAINEQRVEQLRAQIGGYRVLEQSKLEQIQLYEGQLVGLRDLEKKGFFPRSRLLEMERDLARIKGDRGNDIQSIARSEMAIGETRLQTAQLRQKFIEDVLAQLRETQNQIADLRQRVVAAADVLTRLDVLAPQSGVVQNMKIATPGGVIQPAQQLMEIVPVDDRLIVEAQVTPNDIEAIHLGQAAELRFSTLNARHTPVIDARVITATPDRLLDERTGAPYFQIKLEVLPGQEQKMGDLKLQAGLPVDAMIKVAPRSALEYMINPLTDHFARALTER